MRAALVLVILTLGAPPALAIIHGSDAAPGAYPWMAALYFDDPSSGQYCGGTLVAPRIVVTAAHCFSITGLGLLHTVDETLFDGGEVLLGETDLAGAGGERIAVAAYHIHPDYNFEAENDHDIAILELERASVQTPLAWALPADASTYAAGTLSTILGWGVTEGGEGSATLREARVPVVSDADCDAAYDGAIHPATQLCAGYLGVGGVDTCQGDSGGPLVVHKPGVGPLLAGITSWGNGCAEPEFPGVYTEIAAVADFIAQWG